MQTGGERKIWQPGVVGRVCRLLLQAGIAAFVVWQAAFFAMPCRFCAAVCLSLRREMCRLGLQNDPYRNAKRTVSHSQTARFAVRNAANCCTLSCLSL